MSFAHILAADVPLPLCDHNSMRTIAVSDQVSVTGPSGFSLRPCTYYPHEMAHCHTKVFQYAMWLEEDERTLADLRSYLHAHLSPGSSVELWHIWLDGAPLRPAPPRYHGTLAELDEAAFSQLFENSECCLTVKIL